MKHTQDDTVVNGNKKEVKRLFPVASQSMTYGGINRQIDSQIISKESRSFTYHFYPPVVQKTPEEEGPVASGGSVLLMIFINFLSNVVFTIVLPSLPSFIHTVGGQEYLNGWAVAINSFGTFLANPLLGYWADKRNFREVFAFSLFMLFVGNVWYSLSTNMYHIFASRFLVGIAAANYTIANSYLSYATSTRDRAKIMTYNAASYALGFICGPSFSAVTSLVHFTLKFSDDIYLKFTPETAPGWVSAIFALVALLCIIPFKEVPRKPQNNAKIAKFVESSMRSFRSLKHIAHSRMPWEGVLVCLFFSFSITSSFTIFETLGPLYCAANPYTKWDIFHTSIMFLGVSVVSLLALVLLQALLTMITDDRKLEVLFSLVLTSGCIILFDWNDGFVNLPRFLVGVSLVSIGYVNAQALLLSMFSKVLEEHEQGMMMGWLSSSGSLARVTIPIGTSYCWKYIGPNYIFLGCGVLIFMACMSIVVGWRKLASAKQIRTLDVESPRKKEPVTKT